MKDTKLYEQLLGLSAPWYAKEVRLDMENNRVTVVVACQDKTVWGDPAGSGTRAHIHGWTKRTWRHLDTCQFETRLSKFPLYFQIFLTRFPVPCLF